VDSFRPEVRSRIMARIRGAGTKPELFVRRGLFARGYRYRVNSADLWGRPDLKLTKHSAVIFVHGCFWHAHGCGLFRPPSSNVAYWTAKIERNRERDLEDLGSLSAAGWRVCVVWECAIKAAAAGKDRGRLLDGISAWLESPGRFIEFSGTDASSGAAIGRNRSIAAYVAERSPAYGPGRARTANAGFRPSRPPWS
jgi:DNA mismatch endonuclease (patch repair protein)